MSTWEVYIHKETGSEIRAKRMSAEDAAAQPGLDFFKEGDYFVDDSAKIMLMLGELFDKAYTKKESS